MPRPVESSLRPGELGKSPLRSFISLAILLHLICIFFVYSANLRPSLLQQRLGLILAPYTQILHFDPGQARVQFTTGTPDSDDYLAIVSPRLSDGSLGEAEAIRLPGEEGRLSPWRHRLATFTNEMSLNAENEEAIALFARQLGTYAMRTKKLDHVVVQLMRQRPQPLGEEDLIEDPLVTGPSYQAEVWLDEDGLIQMQKRVTGRDAAPTTGKGAGS